MTKRKPLSKSRRFEVFKRDSFACQYCGKKAPEVILHVDHIVPVVDDGTDDPLNLITSCVDCNLGKGARRLDDSTVLDKQRQQLEDLQERREQLEMMVEWQRGLINLDADVVVMVESVWRELTGSIGLNEYGRGQVGKWTKRWGLERVLVAMRAATAKELVRGDDGKCTPSSMTEAFHLIPRIAAVDEMQERDPFARDAYYIRGVLKKRFDDVDLDDALELIRRALRLGSSVDSERAWSKKARSYWSWRQEMLRTIAEWEREDKTE